VDPSQLLWDPLFVRRLELWLDLLWVDPSDLLWDPLFVERFELRLDILWVDPLEYWSEPLFVGRLEVWSLDLYGTMVRPIKTRPTSKHKSGRLYPYLCILFRCWRIVLISKSSSLSSSFITNKETHGGGSEAAWMGNVLLSFLLPSHTTFNIINTSLATSNYTHKECALFLLVPHSYIMLMNQCQFNIILYSLDILGKFHFLCHAHDYNIVITTFPME
jgi:hypothetical protein